MAFAVVKYINNNNNLKAPDRKMNARYSVVEYRNMTMGHPSQLRVISS